MKISKPSTRASDTILIVDDSPDNLTVMKKVLETSLPNITVLTCQHPEKAQTLLRDAEVSLAVLDVQMPKIDGLELCKRIKADPETPFMSVILITSHDSDPKMKAKGLALGADDFITRPMDNAELCARVKVALRVHRAEAILRQTAGQAEDALALEKDRAAEYLDLVEVMMVALDAQGVVTMINRKGCEVLGYDESEVLGKNWFDHFVPEKVLEDIRPISNKLLTGESESGGVFENPILTKKGEERLIAWHNTPIRDANGEIVGHLSSGEDITDRKLAEDALRESEARFRVLFEEAPLGYQSLDENGNIIELNETWCKLFGYIKEEVIGRSLGEFMPSDFQEKFVRIFPEFKRRGFVTNAEFEMIRKDGSGVSISLDGTIGHKPDGSFKQTHCVLKDITEQKSLEEQFRQSQKMESIGQLVGGVAHDFNNLLQVINGYADIARTQLTPEHAAIGSIEEIAKAGGHAKELVQHLLAFSRQQVIEPVDLDLNEEIQNSKEMLQHMIGEHIQVEFVVGKDVKPVFADKGQMHQVLMNLCVNARDAMPDGGALTVQTESVTIDSDDLKTHSWARPGDYVLLSVRDTGCGMDKETFDRIFDPFFTTKEVGKGTGLGLSTVYGIMKQNEGHIEAESEPDKGTVFKIYLPVSHPLSEETVRSASENLPSPEGGIETILVVEDDAMILELATYTLKDAGYTVLTAKDGEEALRVFEEHADEIDLVMMDVVMPRMGGKEAMKKILQKRPSLRHLFVSGYSPDTGHTGFIKEQGAHLLSKPYEADDLLKKIREVLDED